MKKVRIILAILVTFACCSMPLLVYAEAVAPPAQTAGIDLTPMLQAVVALAGSLITVFLIPWIRAKTSVETQAKLKNLVAIAVYAAEQMYGEKKGKEKLAYAEAWLKDRGINVDGKELRAAIEAQVYRMKNILEFEETIDVEVVHPPDAAIE